MRPVQAKTNVIQVIVTVMAPPLGPGTQPGAVYYSVLHPWLWRDGAQVSARLEARRVLLILLGRSPAPVTNEEFYDLLWGHRVDGGPADSRSSLSVIITEAREAARVLGFIITAGYGQGWRIRDAREQKQAVE